MRANFSSACKARVLQILTSEVKPSSCICNKTDNIFSLRVADIFFPRSAWSMLIILHPDNSESSDNERLHFSLIRCGLYPQVDLPNAAPLCALANQFHNLDTVRRVLDEIDAGQTPEAAVKAVRRQIQPISPARS